MSEEVRVRFAPSPTGFFHIGSARTALFNWLYARHAKGKFILRVEDTDHERNTDEALRVLLDGMKWLGLDWDEGPEVGGDCGPYFQSERSDIYKEYLEKLDKAGRIYKKDGAVWFRLLGDRYTEYDERKKCDVEKVDTAPVTINDAIHGKVERREQQDFVLFRSDGTPGFHFVNVVDDIAMGITHVIRGDDHLSNTSKHVELYNAFQVEPPVFAHMPLILKSNGKGKMSKRDEGALIEEYQGRSFLPEAVRNYICLLGWNPKDDSEIMPIDEVISRFDLPGINSAPAHFDEKKMAHFNTEYIRKLPVETLANLSRPLLVEAGMISDDLDEVYFKSVLALCQEKVKSMKDLPEFVNYFFRDDYPMDEKVQKKMFKKGDPVARLEELGSMFERVGHCDEAKIEQAIDELAEAHGVKKFDYFPILRFAVSGSGGGPDLLKLLCVLGQERVKSRLSKFMKTL